MRWEKKLANNRKSTQPKRLSKGNVRKTPRSRVQTGSHFCPCFWNNENTYQVDGQWRHSGIRGERSRWLKRKPSCRKPCHLWTNLSARTVHSCSCLREKRYPSNLRSLKSSCWKTHVAVNELKRNLEMCTGNTIGWPARRCRAFALRASLEPRPSSLRSECSTFVKRAWENCRPSWKL